MNRALKYYKLQANTNKIIKSNAVTLVVAQPLAVVERYLKIFIHHANMVEQ